MVVAVTVIQDSVVVPQDLRDYSVNKCVRKANMVLVAGKNADVLTRDIAIRLLVLAGLLVTVLQHFKDDTASGVVEE